MSLWSISCGCVFVLVFACLVPLPFSSLSLLSSLSPPSLLPPPKKPSHLFKNLPNRLLLAVPRLVQLISLSADALSHFIEFLVHRIRLCHESAQLLATVTACLFEAPKIVPVVDEHNTARADCEVAVSVVKSKGLVVVRADDSHVLLLVLRVVFQFAQFDDAVILGCLDPQVCLLGRQTKILGAVKAAEFSRMTDMVTPIIIIVVAPTAQIAHDRRVGWARLALLPRARPFAGGCG